ncbi:MAG TPA: PAS domain S-box protein [Bryobacteraceae bacterium]|nr:PAS domain S-box protein [Bryobacteraceae bacterium]
MTASKSRSDFLACSGEMGARIRAFDWAQTPLGPIDSWPQAMQTAVSICLNSRFPMVLWLGPELTMLYNDAWRPVLGATKHPHGLGRPGREVWPEIWDIIGAQMRSVIETQTATWSDDLLLTVDRYNYTEEAYFTYSYSPIHGENGICGVFSAVSETTLRVIGERRLKTLSELGALIKAKTSEEAITLSAEVLRANDADVPFALIYLLSEDASRAELAQAIRVEPGAAYSPLSIDLSSEHLWPLGKVARTQTTAVVDDLQSRFEKLPGGRWPAAPNSALVMPLQAPGKTELAGILIAGVSPYRQLDADYHRFYELVAGHIATAIANARAYQEAQRRAEMLAEIDRAKTVFFSNVSHEFRTPLTLMLGPLENLLRKQEIPPEDHEQLATAHRNSLRLLKLVNSLLDFSRLEGGRLKAAYLATDLCTLTTELASNFRSATEAAGLSLVVDCEPLPEPVYVDREMWERIVLNLLSNAYKFTFEGQITVRLHGENGAAVLSVSDTGIGIPDTELPRIFERFHRIEGARGRTYEGTGIGLALTQEYVKLHGGAIAVSSRVGEGSTFTVKVPFGTEHLPPDRIKGAEENRMGTSHAAAFIEEAIAWVPPNGSAAAISSPGGSPTRRPRIILADDNADMREHVRRTLGEEYEVTTASDGQEALELIRQNPPDLLLTDVMMPGCDGLEVLRAVREDARTHTLPVIFLSARAGEEMRVEGLQAGADDYLVKPFTANELRARVHTHIQMAIARRQATEREAALRAEAEQARDRVISVLEGITDGFLSLDRDWRVLYANAEAERLNGMRREEMLGKSHWEIFPAAVGSTIHSELLRAARDRVMVDFESYYAPWQKWFHVKAYPGADGGLSVFFEDITARKMAEELLGQSEERFRAIVETTPECVKVVAKDGTLLLMNPAGVRMVGAGRAEEVIGRNVYDLIAPDCRDDFRVFNEKVCGGEKGTLEFEITGLQGERRHMETHAVPLENRDGSTVQLAITRDVTEQRRRERAALLLSAIVDSSDDAIISKDLNGVVTSWNKSAERLFGYTAQEAIGKSIAELIIPQDRQEEEPGILAKLRRGERVDHFETVRHRKDGSLLDVSLTISPVKDSKGNITGASKIARDITDRKRIESAVQALNAQLTADISAVTRMQQLSTRLVQANDFPQLLGEIVDAGIEITGADMGNIQLLEEGVLKIVSQRGLDQPFLDFFNEVHEGEAACGTALGSGQRVVVEDVTQSPVFAGSPALEVMLAAGARAVQTTPLVSRSGQVLGMFSTHYRIPRMPSERELRLLDVLARQAADLIERKRAEAALITSEGKFRQLAEAGPQIVWLSGPQGDLEFVNRRWVEFSGLDYEATKDPEQIATRLHPEDHLLDHWRKSVETGTPFELEARLRGKDGEFRWFMMRSVPVRDDAGQIVRWVGTSTDIHHNKLLQLELKGANQDLEQFAYSASHDLQEPLRSIKIYGELLTERHGGKLNGEAREFLDYLRTGASRMEMLVRDLLAYTQVTTIEAPSEPIDAGEALAIALQSLRQAINESGATVTHDPLPAVRMHKTHLRQLFQNLVGNAIKYRSPERAPVVHVSAERQNGAWIFSVRDNGIGIEADYYGFIFGLFKRLHTSEDYSGTGLGLAICQRIVERYRGRIWVESEFGQGSTFRFEIPGEDNFRVSWPELASKEVNG